MIYGHHENTQYKSRYFGHEGHKQNGGYWGTDRYSAISCRETFIQDVWQRESEGSTGFENHIAIPHGKSSAVVNTTLAIGRTRQDIPWETLDGSNVRCIILFAVRLEDQNTTHIRLLSQVAGALADDDIIEQLLVESSPQKIIELFSQYAESNVC